MKYLCLFICLLLMTSSVYGGDYLIGKGDGLEVSVWGVPEMSRVVTVRPDGKITLPAVGDIRADHLTPEQLSKNTSAAMKKYVKQPIVTVSVQQIRNNRVYITGGGVSRVFDMIKETTLLKLMSEIGDFSHVDLHHAYLWRNGKKIKSDFYALYYKGDMKQDVELKSDDIIFIPDNKNNLIYVLGAVTTPQNMIFTDGMRVMDAILKAGGFTEYAKDDTVYIVSKNKKKVRVDLEKVRNGKNIDANVVLSAGDYVIVGESLF